MEEEEVKGHPQIAFFGPVYTVVPGNEWAESLIVEGGIITHVGKKEDAEKLLNSGATVVNLGERMLLPGFQDAHVHPLLAGIQQSSCTLSGSPSLEVALDKIVEFGTNNPDAPWILGWGWMDHWFFDVERPAKILDSIIMGQRPIAIRRFDGHACWANTKAMNLAGIEPDTPNPEGGIIDRTKDGSLTGIFHESAANLVFRAAPRSNLETKLQGLDLGIRTLLKYGITAYQEALVRESNLGAYLEYYKSDKVLPKGSLSLILDDNVSLDWILSKRDPENKRLRINTVKFFLDGVIESKTAYLHHPYCNTETRGISNHERDQLFNLVRILDREGFQIHFHAIGDNAITDALDAIEYAQKENKSKSPSRRHHIAHLQVIQPQDIPRFQDLGIVANFQPLWSHMDEDMIFTIQLLGQDRADLQYPIKTLLQRGTSIAFGSDWPVSSVNPLECLHVAVNHRLVGNDEGPRWLPREMITVSQAIEAYTRGSSFVNFLEKETGTLEVGKCADMIVIDRNLLTIPSEEIGKSNVLMTMIDGRVVYGEL